RMSLTLREAITMALDNNRDIAIERANVQMNEATMRGSLGWYDPVVNTTFAYDRRNTPQTNTLFGGPLTTSLATSTGLFQRLPWNGSTVQGSYDQARSTDQNTFNVLNPQYRNTFNLTFTQPLYRNRKTDAGRRQITISRQALDLSDSQFRQRAIDIITQVQRAYWDLVFARRDHEIKNESLGIGRTQLERNQRLVDAGTLAPSDVISTRVEIERRADEHEAANEAVQRAENALKNLMLQSSSTDLWATALEPVEQPQIATSEMIPLTDALRLAWANRPELEQLRLRGEVNQTDIEFFRDQAKPQIDLFANYGITGLAGSERPQTPGQVNTFALLFTRVNQLSTIAQLPPLPVNGSASIDGQFIGNYFQSLGNMFKNEFRSYRFGLNINFPLRNRAALGNLGRSLAESRMIDAQQQKIKQQVEVEVRNALQSVVTAARRVEAARNSRRNAELQYESEQRKFDAGQSTNFFVLDRQNALIAARGRELRALTDYNKATAELQRSLSTTLSSNNVEVKKQTP
ncbi:MAG: TolC family protein, partial [Blastocatellia bacterium]